MSGSGPGGTEVKGGVGGGLPQPLPGGPMYGFGGGGGEGWMMLPAYSQLCAQGALLAVLGGAHVQCRGLS